MLHGYSPLLEISPARPGEMTISDLARMFSVSLRTLRFYEDKDMLHPRRQGTQRFYSAKDRVRLELILKGKRLGFTLAEIRELISQKNSAPPNNSEGTDLIVRLDAKQIEAQIAHLEQQRREMDEAIEELRVAQVRLLNTCAQAG